MSKPKSLIYNLILILTLIFILILGVQYFVKNTIFIPEFEKIEHKIDMNKEYILQQDLKNKVSTLYLLTEDHAVWDETFNFIEGENEDYILETFGETPLGTMQLDYILIYDINLTLIWGQTNISEDFIYKIKDNLENQDSISGFSKLTSGEIILFSLVKVQNFIQNNSNGFILFGEKISLLDLKNELNLKTQYNLEISSLLSNQTNSMYYYFSQKDVLTNQSIFTISFLKDSHINSFFSVFAPQKFVFPILLLIIFIILYFTIKIMITNNIYILSNHMIKIRKEENLEEINFKSNILEISQLYHSFNKLICKIKQQKSQILDSQKKANVDELTQLYNRRFLSSKFKELKQDKSLQYKTYSILLLDIDFFKNYNDFYGHKSGDDILKKISQLLKLSVRKNSLDFVFRYGGEEFLILLSDIDENTTIKIINRIIYLVDKEEIRHKGSKISNFLTLSIGYIHFKEIKNKNLTQLIEKADKALYYSKETGRNKFTDFDDL